MKTKPSQIKEPLTWYLMILLDKIAGFVEWLDLYDDWRALVDEERRDVLQIVAKIVDSPL
jgi:hypothetical protein